MTAPQETPIDDLAPPPPRIVGEYPPRRAVAITPRPKGIHTKHLTVLERFRVRTLYYDACLSKERIRQITGYSPGQIRTAVRAQSAAIGKRPGRPKNPPSKGKSSNGEPPTPNSSDENAELIRQAKHYFEQEDPFRPRLNEPQDGNAGEGGDEEGDTPADISTGIVTVPAQSLSTGSTPATPTQALALEARPTGTGFGGLPTEVRLHIWRCVLSTSPTQVAPSRSWALTVLPNEPWFELGMTPPDLRLENPPWEDYVEARHVPATVLTRVNREARAAVLERCVPILVSQTVRDSSKGIPLFIWIDIYSDIIHFFGEKFRLELFEMAGRCACPDLYK